MVILFQTSFVCVIRNGNKQLNKVSSPLQACQHEGSLLCKCFFYGLVPAFRFSGLTSLNEYLGLGLVMLK